MPMIGFLHRRLLRPRRERPSRRTADEADKFVVPRSKGEDTAPLFASTVRCPRQIYLTSTYQPREKAMTKHMTGTREEWLAARLELLKAEKELTRRSDELARRRQELPWVRMDKEYRFDTDEGSASLADLFKGRSQLLVYQFMFGPDYSSGCPSCSAIADGFNGFGIHLANHDVMLWAVSRAPLEKLQAYKRRMRWSFPWASSFGTDFNSDFAVYASEEQQRTGAYEYNYQPGTPAAAFATRLTSGGPAKGAAMTGTDIATYVREKPGMSAFVLDDGTVYHTYSAYARGLDGLWGAYQWLDRAPNRFAARLVTFGRESVPEPALSACSQFVGFGFSDDRRFFVPVLVLFVLFLLVFIVVGVSRRHHAVPDGDEAPFYQPAESVLAGAWGHVGSCLDVATFTDGYNALAAGRVPVWAWASPGIRRPDGLPPRLQAGAKASCQSARNPPTAPGAPPTG
jgi:predicted dithiol-disulfide oxidoreductase (DUF899 family)